MTILLGLHRVYSTPPLEKPVEVLPADYAQGAGD
jgi:hypothetical protein